MKELLAAIQNIWLTNSCYTSKPEMTRLLRLTTNAVLTRCCATVNFQDVFAGQTQGVMVALTEVNNQQKKLLQSRERQDSCVLPLLSVWANLIMIRVNERDLVDSNRSPEPIVYSSIWIESAISIY